MGQQPNHLTSTATGEKPSRLLFGGLTILALGKDGLDLIGLGSFPVIGTAVTLCFSFTIFMLLLVFDRSGGRGNRRMAQGLVMTLGTLVEGLGFVINFLPLQTLTVIVLYAISYRAWRAAQHAGGGNIPGQARRSRMQQIRAAQAHLRRERVAPALPTAQPRVSEQRPMTAVTSMRQRPQPGRITVKRGVVTSASPIVIPSRAPLISPMVASRQSSADIPSTRVTSRGRPGSSTAQTSPDRPAYTVVTRTRSVGI